MELGGDLAFSNLKIALVVATVREDASDANAAAADKACKNSD